MMRFRRNFLARPLSVTAIVVLLLPAGCHRDCCGHRRYYRRDADRETYRAIAEKVNDPRWEIPLESIEPPAASRLYDPADPDYPPLPPDDPAAHVYMHCADGRRGSCHWHDQGDAPTIESPNWREFLNISKDGELVLTAERSVDLGLLHSREYQSALEDVYLKALTLTLNRFEFDLHWFGRNETTFVHIGTSGSDDPMTTKVEGNETNTLTNVSEFGFTRLFTTGGQLMVDWANSFVWQFTGEGESTASSHILIELMQPLLRRAGRQVRMEALTQGERNTLYAVREFCRFRKRFYFDITTGQSGFLALLLQQQNIRNLEANVTSLKQNLLLYKDRLRSGNVSEIQVDQVFQSYQQGQLLLVQARANYKTALDNFKIRLGLPPTLPVRLSDSLLATFQLDDPKLTELQNEIGKFIARNRQDEAPSPPQLQDGFDKLNAFHDRAVQLTVRVDEELSRWTPRTRPPPTGEDDEDDDREQLHYQQFKKQLEETHEELGQLSQDIKSASMLGEEHRKESWLALQKLAQREQDIIGQLFVVQTQIRVYLIELIPVDMEEADALQYALSSRLDLMNQRAKVIDAWRHVGVAANGLEPDLDVTFKGDITGDPKGDNPLHFDAEHSIYTVGLKFDGPLNRKAERNLYREKLIDYQRARRQFMALEDEIASTIRQDLRLLETNRLNFEIARQSLIVAARQVEQTREQLLLADNSADSSGTQDVLRALNDLLLARIALVTAWINYETARIQLQLDLELLDPDENREFQPKSTQNLTKSR